jgi:glycosyltransferase involved in cell wall biosynthesis
MSPPEGSVASSLLTSRPTGSGAPGTKQLKVLQLIQKPQRRGAELFALQLSEELRRQGVDVLMAYLYPQPGRDALPLGEGDFLLNGREKSRVETILGINPWLLARLVHLLRAARPDIVQLNGARTVKYGAFARTLWPDIVPAVIYRNIGAPDAWLRGPRRRAFYAAVLRRMDGVVALSDDAQACLKGYLRPDVVSTTIPNAVEPRSLVPFVSRADLRKASETPQDVPVVLFVGSLSPEKRVDRLIGAVHDARGQGADLHLWIVGDGPLREEAQDRVAAAGIRPTTRFFGVRKDIGSFMHAADMLALVSDTEGTPGVLLEASFVGLPVVATRVGNVADCVIDGESGFLVDPGDEDGLVDALIRLSTNSDLRAAFGTAGQRLVSRRHLMETVAGAYAEFYRSVVAQSKHRRAVPRPAM